MSLPRITPGYFRLKAEKSARSAVIRNGILLGLVIAAATWLALKAPGPDPNGPGKTPGLVIDGVLGLLFGWRLLVGIGRLRNPSKHPVLHDFVRHGDAVTVCAEIEREVAEGSAVLFDDLIVTSKYLVKLGVAHDVFRLDEIGWVFPSETKHSVNFIPVGTTTALEMYTRFGFGRLSPILLPPDPALQRLLQERVPGARFGYSLENKAWWEQERKR